MTPEEFKNKWITGGDELSPLSMSSLTGLGLSQPTIEFLTRAGLPFDAALFLSFVQNNDEAYNTINRLMTHYDFLEPEYEKYVVIGSCSNGDVIAINTENKDQVAWLDHEDYFSEQFFNSSINSLAECLLVYRDFIKTIVTENGEDAIMDSNFTDKQFENLKQSLIKADSVAMSKEGFWKSDLDMMLAMRQDNN